MKTRFVCLKEMPYCIRMYVLYTKNQEMKCILLLISSEAVMLKCKECEKISTRRELIVK